MRLLWIGVGAVLAVASTSASAGTADRTGSSRTAARAIVAGDLGAAERTLNGERRIFPKRPELMLNLAAIYRQTGRETEARTLYANVLTREDVVMDMLDQRTASSHAIARIGLSRLTQVASR